jgi:methylenetetrahydrofolate dehydrogenase (NADP+) / methenyltetrahydrofolate cyclohydrolase
MKIINGSALAKKIKSILAIDIAFCIEKYNRAPKLELILVGDDPHSTTHVGNKKKAANAIGMECDMHTLPCNTTESELLQLISQFNNDDSVDAILVQLPLPKHLDKNVILNAIDYKKDVDGLHPMNVGLLSTSNDGIIPCTPRGILSLLQEEQIEISGKHCVVIGRSNLVGNPVAQLMLKNNASVTICHSKTRDLPFLTRQAEILIVAIGCPNLIHADMLKEGAVVIDVGINSIDGKLVGDVYNSIDGSSIEKIASAITPVPGGVGPMTIASLLQNTFDMYKKNVSK